MGHGECTLVNSMRLLGLDVAGAESTLALSGTMPFT